jgi:hypothetical protein
VTLALDVPDVFVVAATTDCQQPVPGVRPPGPDRPGGGRRGRLPRQVTDNCAQCTHGLRLGGRGPSHAAACRSGAPSAIPMDPGGIPVGRSFAISRRTVRDP